MWKTTHLIYALIVFVQSQRLRLVEKELQIEQGNLILAQREIKELNIIIDKNNESIQELMKTNESLSSHFTEQRNELKRVKQNDKDVSDWSAEPIPDPIKRLYNRRERIGAEDYRK